MRFNRVVLSLIGLVFSIEASASDFQNARTAGLGGAGHAFPVYTEAIYLNPSYLSLLDRVAVSGDGLILRADSGSFSGIGSGAVWNIAAMSGVKSLPIQFGAGFTRVDRLGLLHLALSKEILDSFSVGVGSKMVTSSGLQGNFLDINLSFTLIPTPYFRMSLNFDNLTEALADLGFRREFVLGTRFSPTPNLSLLIDPHWTATQLGFEAGIEYLTFEYLFLRAGGFQNASFYGSQRGDGLSLGVGLSFPAMSINYGLTIGLAPLSFLTHNIGATFSF